MQDNLAPIGLSTYARLQHLRQTVDALKKNMLASQSELYVFSDAPKLGDEEKVAAVRSYLRTIEGFKRVHIIERESNGRVANNRGGIKQLLDSFGRVIWLPEDSVTAPGFLRFMNDALEFYEDDSRIFSVCGCPVPVPIPQGYPYDVYILPRYGGWGDGFWADRYAFDKYITEKEYRDFISDKAMIKRFNQRCGSWFLPLIEQDAAGNIDAGDVKALFWMFIHNKYTVYPRESLAVNIGCDNSGEHSEKTDRFDNVLSSKEIFHLEKNIQENANIIAANARFFQISLMRRFKRYIRHNLFQIKYKAMSN